jgi:hypothetical protein
LRDLLLPVKRNNISVMATIGESARHIFLSEARFKVLVAAGVITKQPAGGYVLDEVRREVLTHLRDAAGARGAGTTLAHERALLAHAQRRLVEMKADEMAGRLVPIEDAGAEIEAEYGVIRDRLLCLSGSTAASLVGCDRATIGQILDEKIAEILNELSSPDEIIERVQPDAANASRRGGGAAAAADGTRGGSGARTGASGGK